jgi:MinD superfamily P-loop ATPase
MRLVVASGKGGTGKTLVATHLAWLAAERGLDATYADADVEVPNGHLCLWPSFTSTSRHTVLVPALRSGSCSACGRCHEFCAFQAILPLQDHVLVFPELCHSCGGCLLVCPEDALIEVRREVGTIRRGTAGRLHVIDGVLDVGEPRAVPLIHAVLEGVDRTTLTFTDAPPGTSCAVVAAMTGADRVVLVTEPTPFGLHDLALAVDLCRASGLPAAAVVNRADLGDDRPLRRYLEQERIPILAEWPYDTELAASHAQGVLAARQVPRFREAVERLLDACLAPWEAPP